MNSNSLIIRKFLKLFSIIILSIFLFSNLVQSKTNDIPDCEFMASIAEEKYDFPAGVLSSISNVEAGRISNNGEKRGWPWTVNHAGEGLFFESNKDAIDYVKEALQSGDMNLDVGCMQISLKWHSINFETLESAFDPVNNIEYAAQFLNNLYISHGSWEQAIKHYHSSDPKKNIKYHKKVLAAWSRSKEDSFLDIPLENMLIKTNLLLPISKPDLESLNILKRFEPEKSKIINNNKQFLKNVEFFNMSKTDSANNIKEKGNNLLKNEHKSKFIIDRWKLVLIFREQLSK